MDPYILIFLRHIVMPVVGVMLVSIILGGIVVWERIKRASARKKSEP
jgi:hypothetical protein